MASLKKRKNFYLKEKLFPDLVSLYSNFKQRLLTVSSTIDDFPFFKLKLLPNGSYVPESGIDMSLTNCLSETLNFR